MYQLHYQVSHVERPYHPVSSMPHLNSIPNNPPHFHSISTDPSYSHHPPSHFNPYPNSGSYPHSASGFEAQPTYYQDHNAVPANWVVKESAPVRYLPAIQPLYKEATALTSYDTSLTSIRAHENLVRNTDKRRLKRPKTIRMKTSARRNVRCDLCKIECTDIQLYEKHISGKRHTKNLEKIYASGATSSAVPTFQSINKSSCSSEHCTLDGQDTSRVKTVPTDLETKKHRLLEVGTAVQSLRVCTVCNVACNGEIVFADHLAGKKHMTQVRALCSGANSNSNSVSNPMPKPQEKITKKIKNGGSARCDVCKISCTSSEGLMVHRQGKKHKKNLQKLVSSTSSTFSSASKIAQPSTNLPAGDIENTEATKANVPEGARTKEPADVETKKRKVLGSGTAATAVRTCVICKVVCNSETVFKSHLAGQKHAAMVKQAEAGMTVNNQQLLRAST